MRRFFGHFFETIEVILIALVTVFVIRSFIVQPFLVSGASMEPTFSNGNYLIIDEITYRFRPPERGEVIVFRPPVDQSTFFIKRVIGLPNEKITIKNNQITVIEPNSETVVLSEPYLSPSATTIFEKTITLGPDEYFVMGDNRSNSFDSRNWGPLKKSEITGVVRLRILPVNNFNFVTAPQYK